MNLNQGRIFIKFKLILERKNKPNDSLKNIIDEYINFIEDSNYEELLFDMKYVYDLLSKKNIISKNGLNIIIFKQIPHKIINENINNGNIFISYCKEIQ